METAHPNKLFDVPRTGFDTGFLATAIDFPALRPEHQADAVVIDGSPVIDYTHFSLTMSRSRRFARWVGWNIDGASIKLLDRAGISFRKDPRLPTETQVGNELYMTAQQQQPARPRAPCPPRRTDLGRTPRSRTG